MSSRRHVLSLALAASLAPQRLLAESVPQVAAASDLAIALPEVAAAFHKRTGASVRLAFGPTAKLADQIAKGSAYEVFMAADESYVDQLNRAGRTSNSGALYGIGRIGLFVPKTSKVRVDGRLGDLVSAVRDGRLQKLAISNPDAGPYGRATREALKAARAWPNLQSNLALGETGTRLVQMALSGTTQAAILPYTLWLDPKTQAAGTFALIPADWHRPLRQRAVVVKGGSPTAEAFYRFLRGPEARAILRGHGFILPGGR